MKQLVFGRNSVAEWLATNGPTRILYIMKNSRGAVVDNLMSRAKQQGVKIQYVDKTVLNQMTQNAPHQGVVAEVDFVERYTSWEDFLHLLDRKDTPGLLAILDSVQDPHNLGAIIRSAEGAGLDGLIIPKDRSAGLSPTVFKTSAGAAAHLPVVQVTNLVRTIKELKDLGYWFAGADQSGDRFYDQPDWSGPMGIVLGSEGSGMRRLVREQCDFLIQIPILGTIESLNVSAAAAILFFEAQRQRRSP